MRAVCIERDLGHYAIGVGCICAYRDGRRCGEERPTYRSCQSRSRRYAYLAVNRPVGFDLGETAAAIRAALREDSNFGGGECRKRHRPPHERIAADDAARDGLPG